jgi:hypothetical protein|tara:strand:- start:914 stop:1828 length:915 start_codon:yes stop_codon:yes gene_type:complete
MLITFSIPSIRELKVITHCVRDLYEKADDPENIEVIVRLDEEDNRDEGFINNIKGSAGEYKDNVKVIVGKKMYGYCSGTDMNKEIIDIMKGEWLFIYNDDCTSITKGYDSVVKKYNGKMVLLSTKNECNLYDFGIYPKKFIEVNGRLQYSCYTNWDMETWQKYFPELFVLLDNDHQKYGLVQIDHKATAGHGMGVSLFLHCGSLHTRPGYEDYPWSRLHLGLDGEVRTSDDQPKGLNKWYKICMVDIPNMKTWLRENPEWIQEGQNPDDWEVIEYSNPNKTSSCKCCDEQKVKESRFLRGTERG